MKDVQKIYLSLLRSALWGNDPHSQSNSPINYKLINYKLNNSEQEALLYICLRQGTGPLIFDLILRHEDSLKFIVYGIKDRCKQVCMQNMLLQEQMRMIMSKALSALSEGGVQATTLKGFALAAHYPQLHLRQWGDIDIYVGDEGYHQAAEILRTTFPGCPCYEEEEEYFKHWNVNVGNTAIEAHRVSAVLMHPGDNRLWHRLEQEAMPQAATEIDVEGMRIRVPEEKWNILFVFLHSWQHYTESHSAKMQQLCDLALLLHAARSTELHAYLHRNLRKMRLTQIWQAYAYIMVQHLGLPAEECPLYTPKAAKRGEMLLKQILEGRDYTAREKTSKVSTNIVLRKLYTLRNKIADSLQTWDISPIYTLHDIMGKILEGMGRLLRGEINRKWE